MSLLDKSAPAPDLPSYWLFIWMFLYAACHFVSSIESLRRGSAGYFLLRVLEATARFTAGVWAAIYVAWQPCLVFPLLIFCLLLILKYRIFMEFFPNLHHQGV